MFSALIIGAGQIAGGYDTPSDKRVLTHAHGYKTHGQFDLLGFYDIDKAKADSMAKKWNVKSFKSPPPADVISVCTPDGFHLSSLKQALALHPKLVFLEKPLSNDPKEAGQILKLSKRLPILVNYSRRFVKEFYDINKMDLGRFQTGHGYYGKGFLHNGSHMLDLLNLLLGKIQKVRVFDSFVDFDKKDPTKTAVLTFKKGGRFFMQGVDCRHYSIFEVDLLFQKKRVRIIDSGFNIEIYEIEENPRYKGYRGFHSRTLIETSLDQAMSRAVDNIYRHLTVNEVLLSPVSQAYEIFECLK